MTDQQLHEKAQKFADDHQSWVPDEQSKGAMYNAFLAGASSVGVANLSTVRIALKSIATLSTDEGSRHVAKKGLAALLSESTSSSEPVGDDAVLFAEFLNKNHMAFDGFGGWAGKINTNHYGSSSKDLYKLFKQRK